MWPNSAASNRRAVRSPEAIRDRTTTAANALSRPTTASAEMARDSVRLTSESPRDAGYGKTIEVFTNSTLMRTLPGRNLLRDNVLQ